MHRISSDKEYYADGKIVIDADGIPFEPAAKSDLTPKADTSYVDEGRWRKSLVMHEDTLDSLAEGVHEVRSGSVANSLGIPYGVIGTLEIVDTGGARNALYISNHALRPRVYANARVNETWSGWKMQANWDDLDTKADISSLSGLATEQYVDDAIAGISPNDPPAPAINMALLGAPVTPWESAGIVTNYDQGELYLEQLKTQFVFVKKVTVGQTYQGRDINALVIGDDTKPVVMIECGTHGNEVASREAVMIWARKAAQYRTWMDDICLVIIPTVNGDRTGHNRENAQSKDINRDFGNFETSEAQAVRDAFDTYNPVFYLCCHEFEHTSDVNDIETSSPSNYAWFTNQQIIDDTDRVVGKIWTAVQDKGATVDHYYTTGATEPEGPVDTAMSWLMRVKEIPSVLIETAGGLYPKTYSNQVGVHPARYNPPLDRRVDLYLAALDAALSEIAEIVTE